MTISLLVINGKRYTEEVSNVTLMEILKNVEKSALHIFFSTSYLAVIIPSTIPSSICFLNTALTKKIVAGAMAGKN